MNTKKADTPKSRQPLERGRFAKLLAAGYTIEVEPSPKRAKRDVPSARSSAAGRRSKA